jgi:hypothetical protein
MDGANHGTPAPADATGKPSAAPIPAADPPTPRQVRSRKFLQSLRKFWIAGAAGAYFSALSHNLPTDLMALRNPSRPPFALGHFFLQYGYVFWLLFYFFISSFDVDTNEKHTWWDVSFDIAQSFLALVVAFKLLVFVNSKPGNAFDSQMFNYGLACVVIFFISVGSFLLFSPDTPLRRFHPVLERERPKAKGIDRLRGLAAFFALLSLAIVLAREEPRSSLIWLGILLAALWGILGRYTYLTVTDA